LVGLLKEAGAALKLAEKVDLSIDVVCGIRALSGRI
jgi:hypothetical protein